MVKQEQGFSLIELIVAITLMTMGLFGLLSVNALMTRMLTSSNRASTAAFYSQQRLETLRGMDCDGVSSGSELKEGTYQLVWTVQPTFNDKARSVELRTYYSSTPTSLRADTVETSVLCVR